MQRVHLVPAAWAAGGVAALVALDIAIPISPAGWVAGVGYLLVSTVLLSVGLARRGARRLGAANATTATRSTLVGLVTALVATAFTQPVPPLLLVAIVVPALALDAVDGWLARRTHGETPLGARFDMEVDAFLLLVLSVDVARALGGWVLAIGLLRYAFVAAGWALPWMQVTLPPRYWRKVVTAVCGIALTLATTQLAPPPVAAAAVGIALALLVESFGRDVVWLARMRMRSQPSAERVAQGAARTRVVQDGAIGDPKATGAS